MSLIVDFPVMSLLKRCVVTRSRYLLMNRWHYWTKAKGSASVMLWTWFVPWNWPCRGHAPESQRWLHQSDSRCFVEVCWQDGIGPAYKFLWSDKIMVLGENRRIGSQFSISCRQWCSDWRPKVSFLTPRPIHRSSLCIRKWHYYQEECSLWYQKIWSETRPYSRSGWCQSSINLHPIGSSVSLSVFVSRYPKPCPNASRSSVKTVTAWCCPIFHRHRIVSSTYAYLTVG